MIDLFILNKKISGLILLGIILVTLLFGLWPLNFHPPNRVEWLKDEPGVRITGPGHLFSLPGMVRYFPDQSVSLEIWLRPSTDNTNRYCNILSFWDGGRQAVFLIGQHTDELYLRVPNLNPGQTKKYRERWRDHFLVKGQAVILTVTSTSRMTTIYKNGLLNGSFSTFSLLKESGGGSGILILGNSAVGGNWWKGDILGLAIYNRVLPDHEAKKNFQNWIQRDYQEIKRSPGLVGFYPFNEGRGELVKNQAGNGFPIFKPAVFQPLHKIVLEWPSKEYRKHLSFYLDVAVNFFGFIPLGFFVALHLLRFNHRSVFRSLYLTVVLGSLISLAIELTQVWLPSRDSSASDLVFNILGTFVGAGFISFWNIDLKLSNLFNNCLIFIKSL
jgi:VanZ family protein